MLDHCYFWSHERQLDFIQEVIDWLHKDPGAKADIERDAKEVIFNNWKEEIDTVLVQGTV